MVTRPPIVTIMGHVDHGKTSLLDYIRKTKVASGESGGITQHIGAYEIKNPDITFIDTPGHAAFSQMRARGGQVADLVVLVVAANDGIKPQTEESLKHIQEAGVPFIVAINKMDLPQANVDLVKQQLVGLGYPTEDLGGQVVTVPVSAVTGQGVDQLLEMITISAEMLELKADPQADLEALVIESEMDKNKGPVATMIIKNGTLKVGDQIHAETVSAKVKAMFNHLGATTQEALPSQPVLVLGFEEVPPVGAQVHAGLVTDLPVVRDAALPILPASALPETLHLPIIIKADVAGSMEALKYSMPEGVVILMSGVGDINENDVLMAKTTGARVVGFNVKISKSVSQLAETEKVATASFKIIYELIQYLEDQYKRLIDPLYGIEILAEAEIMAEFKINQQRIIGGKVTKGELLKEYMIFLMREGNLMGKARIKSLRQGKQEVVKVNKGSEFGAIFSPQLDFKPGDIIIAHR